MTPLAVATLTAVVAELRDHAEAYRQEGRKRDAEGDDRLADVIEGLIAKEAE